MPPKVTNIRIDSLMEIDFKASESAFMEFGLLEFLVYIGAVVTFLGLLGLGYCIWAAIQIKRGGGDAQTVATKLQRLVAINFAAVAFSTIGLMTVVIGVLL
jgi:hypothetical protein